MQGLLHSDLTANNILLQSVGGLPLDLTAAFEASELELTPAASNGEPAATSFVAKVGPTKVCIRTSFSVSNHTRAHTYMICRQGGYKSN